MYVFREQPPSKKVSINCAKLFARIGFSYSHYAIIFCGEQLCQDSVTGNNIHGCRTEPITNIFFRSKMILL